MATIYWRPGGRKHRPGAVAYLNWREGGQQVRRSLGKIGPDEAAAICAAKEAELTHGVQILPKLPAVDEYLDWYESWYEADHPTTIGKLKSELKAFRARFGRRAIDSIRPIEVETWRADRLKTHARETVGKEIRRLKTAFARGVQWREIDVNPVGVVTAPRGVRDVAVVFYGLPEIAALYAANPARAPLWSLAVNTGMRRRELAKATKADVVDYGSEQRIRIESTPDEAGEGRTKSGRWREVPLNAAAVRALAALPDALAAVHPDTLSDWFAADAEAAGIGGTLHRLRHTFCAHLAMAGVPLRRIQVLAGHSDYKVTERYAHLCPAGADAAVALLQFDPADAK
jgi:integrase